MVHNGLADARHCFSFLMIVNSLSRCHKAWVHYSQPAGERAAAADDGAARREGIGYRGGEALFCPGLDDRPGEHPRAV
jgi:hypothetical protein